MLKTFTTLSAVGGATAILWLVLAEDFGVGSLGCAVAIALAVAFWSHLGAV